MVSSHSSNLTQPKWFLRAKNVPLTQAPPPQFWKTMLVLSGYFDDPLWNVSLFRDSFEFLIGNRNEKSMEARAWWIIQRIQVLENVKRRGVILADICLVPIYSEIGKPVMQINQSMGLPYKDWGIKFKGNSKQQIIKAAWASYGVELVKYYKPRHLVILGKGVHKAIGQDELGLVMQGMGGEYIGYNKHPSWNGHYGYNIMPLLCKLQEMVSPPPEVALAASGVTLPAGTDVQKQWQMKSPPPEVAMAAVEVNLTTAMHVEKQCNRWPCLHQKWHRQKKWTRQLWLMLTKRISTRTWTWKKKDNASMVFSLDGFSEEENQDEQITKVLDEWMNDLV